MPIITIGTVIVQTSGAGTGRVSAVVTINGEDIGDADEPIDVELFPARDGLALVLDSIRLEVGVDVGTTYDGVCRLTVLAAEPPSLLLPGPRPMATVECGLLGSGEGVLTTTWSANQQFTFFADGGNRAASRPNDGSANASGPFGAPGMPVLLRIVDKKNAAALPPAHPPSCVAHITAHYEACKTYSSQTETDGSAQSWLAIRESNWCMGFRGPTVRAVDFGYRNTPASVEGALLSASNPFVEELGDMGLIAIRADFTGVAFLLPPPPFISQSNPLWWSNSITAFDVPYLVVSANQTAAENGTAYVWGSFRATPMNSVVRDLEATTP